MSKGAIKVDLFEVLRGDVSLREALDYTDREMRETMARDIRAFIEQTLRGPREDRIAFIRVPKCATTSIHTEIMRGFRSLWSFEGQGLQHVHPGACDDASEGREEVTWHQRGAVLSYYLCHPKTRYTWGHVAIDRTILESFGDEFSFITTFRHPVDRWISHYLYNKHRRKSDPRYDIDTDIETFLSTDRGQGIGEVSTSYYSGTAHVDGVDRTDEEVQRRARENLERFDVVGIVEEMEKFERDFAETFSFEIDVGRRNKSPAPDDEKKVSDEERSMIRDACEADLRLYDWARERFGS